MDFSELSKALDRCVSIVTERGKFEIKKVIFHCPATVILWADGTKTVVKCQPGDTYDREKGFLLAVCKRVYGDTGKYNDIIHRALGNKNEGPNKEVLTVSKMRRSLDIFCQGQHCHSGCPLVGPICRCGRGASFVTMRDGKYTMTDEEIKDAYRIVFGPEHGGNE